MPEPRPIIIPLVNPNEPEAVLAALDISAGQPVQRGQRLATLETTKAASDLLAEADGFVIGLRYAAGDSIRAGEVLAYLAERADTPLPERAQAAPSAPASADAPLPAGLRITQPALALARQLGLDLAALPTGQLVTEAFIRSQSVSAAPESAGAPSGQAAFDAAAVLVYGGGGHGKSLIDLLRVLGSYQIAGVLDDSLPVGAQVLGVPVLGGGSLLPELTQRGLRLAVNAVGGIGSISSRAAVFQRLAEAGFACPAVIHPSAYVEPSARLSAGVQVFPHAYIGSDAEIGFGCIVNTGAIVSHDSRLGQLSNISPGAKLAGGVQVGERVLIGMGATVNLNVNIGTGARVGNGATVKSDVPAGAIVRAGTIWPE